MKYWNFDVCRLISDYKKNRKVCIAVDEEIKTCEKLLDDPIGNTSRAEWEFMLRLLDIRKAEYELYCSMVAIGLEELPEVEREVIKLWLIENRNDSYIIEYCAIDGREELNKIKALALSRFTSITMPN